jgi:hypothetical protein
MDRTPPFGPDRARLIDDVRGQEDRNSDAEVFPHRLLPMRVGAPLNALHTVPKNLSMRLVSG